MESTYIFVEGLFLDIATLQSWDSTQFLFLERGNKTDSGGGEYIAILTNYLNQKP